MSDKSKEDKKNLVELLDSSSDDETTLSQVFNQTPK